MVVTLSSMQSNCGRDISRLNKKRNGAALEVELDVGDVVAGVDGLRNDVPLEQLAAVDVAAVCVSNHHPNSDTWELGL